MQTQEDLPVNIKGHDKVNDLKKYWDALVSKQRKLDNEIKEAERIDQILQPVHKSLFIESNPSPVKYAAKLLGLCDDIFL